MALIATHAAQFREYLAKDHEVVINPQSYLEIIKIYVHACIIMFTYCK